MNGTPGATISHLTMAHNASGDPLDLQLPESAVIPLASFSLLVTVAGILVSVSKRLPLV